MNNCSFENYKIWQSVSPPIALTWSFKDWTDHCYVFNENVGHFLSGIFLSMLVLSVYICIRN